MEKILIIGDTGGVGSAIAARFRGQGAQVTGLSRSTGLDLIRPETIAPAFAGLSGPFDWVWICTGILAPVGAAPEKALSRVEPDDMAQVFAVNAIGPALILAQLPRLLPRDRSARIGVLSARVGSIGDNRLGGWHSYRASKAALNQIIRGAAIELARTHPQTVLLALHPGTVDTSFTAQYPGRDKSSPETAADHLITVLGAVTPAQTGQFLDHKGAAVPW